MRAAALQLNARLSFRRALCAALAIFAAAVARAEQPFTLDGLRARAKELAKNDYVARPVNELPEWLAKLDYDGYRRLRFRPETMLWAGDGLPFRMQFMHRGYLFRQKVTISVIDGADVRELAFSPKQFDYGANAAQTVPDNLGYSGFALRHPLEKPDRWDEFAVFQGATYFRLLAAGEVYGASARGLAIGTAAPKGEEFPDFVEFWIEKPAPGAARITVYALLDSPSTTGAFRFVLAPGAQTTADVSAYLYPRSAIEKLGIAPLTSMFLVGESRLPAISEWRPEVHDSDGLAIANADGTWTWRPLVNPEHTHRITRIPLENPAGFGLFQRDRSFASYEDLESRFEMRPSYWVAPHGGWGKGAIELVEIPTSVEWNENAIAYWVPDKPVSKGDEIPIEFTLSTFTDDPSRPPLARAMSTRVKVEKDAQLFVIDFMGPGLEAAVAGLSADVVPARGTLRNLVLQRNEPEDSERCSFELVDAGKEPLDVRVTLRRAGRAVSETLFYSWVRP
jgi:glucans biosynthesis protein